MDNLRPFVRNVARAVIVRNGRILLLRKDGYESGERICLAVGARDPGETLAHTLKRECHEEIGHEA